MLKQLFLQVLTDQNRFVGAARLAHWNVEGPEFYQYHLLFERVYGIIDEKVDSLAEQARGAGVEIRALVFNSVPEIDWSTPVDLCEKLLVLNDDLILSLKGLRREAESEMEYGIVNIVEDIMSDCNSIKYLLGSVTEDLS